jgi:HK97 family phage portal protein
MSMNFLKKIFRRAEARYFTEGWQGSKSGQMLYGNTPVHPANAEGIAAVFACVAAISSAISALPALVYQNQGKIRSEVYAGAIPALIKNGPNFYQTWPEFMEMLVAQVLLRGNGLIEIVADRAGNVVELRVIPWNWCNPYMLPGGQLVYDVFDQPGIWAPAQGKRRRLLQHEVIHVRDRSDDGLIGMSRLQRAASVVRSAQAVNDFAAAAFHNGFYPSGIVMSDAVINPAQREGLNDAFVKSFSGAKNAARAIILDQGLKWQSLTAISPEDAELLKSRQFSVVEICRLFQVPPPIIQDLSNSTFTNATQVGRWFSMFCLFPLVRKLEASFNRALFEATDFELVLDMSSFERGDPENRWKAHAVAAREEILTVDEIREIEGWGPKARESDTGGNDHG